VQSPADERVTAAYSVEQPQMGWLTPTTRAANHKTGTNTTKSVLARFIVFLTLRRFECSIGVPEFFPAASDAR
jgi:hypothetical protein